MVTPETSGSDDPKRASARWMVPAALVVVVAAVAAVFTLTAPNPPAADDTLPTTPTTFPSVELPSTTTTTAPFRVADVVSGPQIAWASQLIPGTLIDVIERDGEFYLFTADGQHPLQIWIWSASTWKLYAQPSIGFRPVRVIQAGDSFIAFGTDDYGTPMATVSADGAGWQSLDLPPHPPDRSVWLEGAAAANGDTIVIFAQSWSDPGSQVLAKALANRGLDGYLERDDDGTAQIVVTGPLGLPLALHTPNEFGIDPSEFAPVEYRSEFTALVGTLDATSWQWVVLADHVMGSPEFDHLEQPFVGPDGKLWASGVGSSVRTFASADGITWTETAGLLPELVVPWNEDYLSVSRIRVRPTISRSSDLAEWEDVFVADFLPQHLQWGQYYYPELVTGGAGIAMTVRSTSPIATQSAPAFLEQDGFLLTSNSMGMFLMHDGQVVVSADHWWRTSGQLVARLADDGLVISHPETGEDLVTFDLDDLEAFASQQHFGEVTFEYDHHVLIFSPDGETWTVQDLGGMVRSDASVRLAVGEDRILAIVSGGDETVVWTGFPPKAGGG